MTSSDYRFVAETITRAKKSLFPAGSRAAAAAGGGLENAKDGVNPGKSARITRLFPTEKFSYVFISTGFCSF